MTNSRKVRSILKKEAQVDKLRGRVGVVEAKFKKSVAPLEARIAKKRAAHVVRVEPLITRMSELMNALTVLRGTLTGGQAAELARINKGGN